MIGSRGAGHLARSLELARYLASDGVHVGFACGHGRWRNLVEAYGFEADELYEPQLSPPMCHGVGHISANELLRAYISEHELLRVRRPRLVVCDWRMTAAISTQDVAVPCVQIWNSNWGCLAGHDGWASPSLQHGFREVADHWRDPYRAFCGAVGAPDSTDIAHMLRGSANVVTDHPVFRSIEPLDYDADPHWIGPLVPWPTSAIRPDRLPTRDLTVAFGGHELTDLSTTLLSVAEGLGLTVHALSTQLKARQNWDAWSFFPDELFDSHFVVTHGGIGSIYQALLAGKPVLVVPQHLEHLDNGQCAQRLGVGLCLPIGERDPSAIAEALTAMRASDLRRATLELTATLNQSRPLEAAANVIREHL